MQANGSSYAAASTADKAAPERRGPRRSVSMRAVLIRDGGVSLPHGGGHGDDAITLDVARKEPGVSANTLTDHNVVDVLSGNAVFNGVPVSIAVV